MKKLIITSVLIAVFINSYTQRVYTPDEYLNQAYENNIISFTISPLVLSPGILFISKPIGEFYKPISIFSSFEYANYKSVDTKLFKLAIGPSIIIRNFNLNTGICINTDPDQKIENYKEFSFEIGLTTKFEKIYLSILTDPLNNHFKFGIGLGF